MTLKFKKVNGNILFAGYSGHPPENDVASQLLTLALQKYRHVSLDWNLAEEVREIRLQAIRIWLELLGYQIDLEENNE